MARITRCLYILFVLVLFFQAASGSIAVKDVSISPGGNLISGQDPPEQVKISFGVTFFPEGGVTFSSQDSLHMNTDLDNAKWTYITILDGFPSPQSSSGGKKLDITGWELSYPSKRTLSLAVNVTGDVPKVASTEKKTLLRVADVSANGVIPGSEVIKEANIILAGSTPLHATDGSETGTPVATQTTAAPASKPKDTGQVPESISLPAGIITLVILLISFIPLGLLVFHDFFGIGKLTFPIEKRMRTMAAVLEVICGAGLIYILLAMQKTYALLAGSGNGFAPVIALVGLFIVSYLALSAFTLAVGSLLDRAFKWTLRVHQAAALVAVILIPVVLLSLGNIPGSPDTGGVVATVSVIAAILSGIVAIWLDRSLNQELGREDWVARVLDVLRRAGHRTAPHAAPESNAGSALAILNTRLAKGEISLEEYNQMKEAIRK